jgi:hypothetical protein
MIAVMTVNRFGGAHYGTVALFHQLNCWRAEMVNRLILTLSCLLEHGLAMMGI